MASPPRASGCELSGLPWAARAGGTPAPFQAVTQGQLPSESTAIPLSRGCFPKKSICSLADSSLPGGLSLPTVDQLSPWTAQGLSPPFKGLQHAPPMSSGEDSLLQVSSLLGFELPTASQSLGSHLAFSLFFLLANFPVFQFLLIILYTNPSVGLTMWFLLLTGPD